MGLLTLIGRQLELEQVFSSERWTTMNKAKMWSDTLLPLKIQPLETDIVDILCGNMGITLVSTAERDVQRHNHFAPVQASVYSGWYRQPCMSCFTAAHFQNRLEYQIDFHCSCAQVFS